MLPCRTAASYSFLCMNVSVWDIIYKNIFKGEEMLLFVLSFIISLVPSLLVIFYILRRKKEDLGYQRSCKSAIGRGAIAVLPIIGLSAVFHIINALVKRFLLPDMHPLIFQAVHTFIVLAFVEELVKFFCFKGVLKKKYNEYTWADVVAFMVLVGDMFGLVEDIPYAIGASPMVMLIRGLTVGHIGYGFVMGWLYGKKLYTGKKKYGFLAFMIPFLLHGLYDFSLSSELLEINEDLAFIGISLALVDIILFISIQAFKEKGEVQCTSHKTA